MDLQTLTSFFMYCTLLNVGLLLISTLLGWMVGLDSVYRMHSKFFPVPKETFNAVIYALIGLWKIAVIVFNLIPWIAVTIIG